MSFVKLDSGIIHSSIWCEDAETKVVWITMLALADMHGVVSARAPGISSQSGVSIDKVRRVLVLLESPDGDSRSQEFAGRRIATCDEGFLILNYDKYRARRDPEKRRMQVREAVARHRAKGKCNPDVIQGKPKKAQAEAEAEADLGDESPNTPLAHPEDGRKTPKAPKISAAQIEMVYQAYPRRVGKGAALKQIRKAIEMVSKDRGGVEEAVSYLVQVTSLYASSPAGQKGEYTPYPATWFCQQHYDDDTSEWQMVGDVDPKRVARQDEIRAQRQQDRQLEFERSAVSAVNLKDLPADHPALSVPRPDIGKGVK